MNISPTKTQKVGFNFRALKDLYMMVEKGGMMARHHLKALDDLFFNFNARGIFLKRFKDEADKSLRSAPGD